MDAISAASSALSYAPAARREAVEIEVIRQAVQAEQATAQLVVDAVQAAKSEFPAVPADRSVGTVVDRRI